MALTKFSHGPSKVAKSIRKKKGADSTTSLHANSRDARKLNRATMRDEKLYRHALIRDRANEKFLRRVEFFKIAAEQGLEPSASASTSSTTKPAATASTSTAFSPSLLGRLISTYISRHEPELSALSATRRPGRPASTRETALRQEIADEEHEFETGFWMPDLRYPETVAFLAERWDGKWASLAPAKWVRCMKVKVSVDGKEDGDGEGEMEVTIRESKFPPKGDA